MVTDGVENDLESVQGNGWINEIGFTKAEQKNLELEENLIYNDFKKKIKRWAYFVMVLSAYVLLNVCIGFSSAPFYKNDIECYVFDPTPLCAELKSNTAHLYFSELIYGIMMITQGTIGMVLVDNIRVNKFAILLKKSCKICIIGYIILFILRIGLFFEVHRVVMLIDPSHDDKGIGSFFAEYISYSMTS